MNLKQTLLGYLEIACHYALRCFPVYICSGIGCAFGRILGPRHRKATQRLRNNIIHLRPDLVSKKDIDDMVLRSWGNYGRVMAEFSVFRRICQSSQTQIIGLDHLQCAQASERPVIIMFLHLANWEMVGPRLKDFVNERSLQVYQLLEDKTKLKLAEKARRPYAKHLIPNTPNMAKQIYNKLKEGYTVFMGVDEFINNKLPIPSFGRPLSLSNNLAFAVRFAQLTNAVLCPVYAVRTKGVQFEINIKAPVVFDFSDYNKQKLHGMVAQLDQLIDPIIRQHIDQWHYAMALDLEFGQSYMQKNACSLSK